MQPRSAVGPLALGLLVALGLASAPAEARTTVTPAAAERSTMVRTAPRPPADPEDPSDPRPRHSSDGLPGEIAPVVPPGQRGWAVVSGQYGFEVAPGLRYRRWDRTDARGRIRAYLLTATMPTAGLRLDYAAAGKVRRRAVLTDILARDQAVAGVNGDFFDIADTGAPLGVGQDREQGLRLGRASGWNEAFFLTADGTPRIGTLPLEAEVRERPGLAVSHVNSPTVMPNTVGVYTPGWGRTAGYRVTDGVSRPVREVVVRDGTVRSNRPWLSTNAKIDDLVLVGRGDGAAALAGLAVGDPVTVRRRLAEDPEVAITGNQVLLRDGELAVVDDREMHPRTAVGIDVDRGRLLLLVVDGRQSISRGYTMVELARMMRRLGAEDALNLDGGGSSTMVALRPGHRVAVRNSPSDGSQRPVPNGLLFGYRPPIR